MNPKHSSVFDTLFQTEDLTQVLEQIQICWEVWRTLKATGTLKRRNLQVPPAFG